MTVDDPFARVTDLPPSPRPDTPPVWLAGRSPEALELAGRLGDGWNAWAATPEEFALEAEQVRRAAAGRPVALTWAGLGLIAADLPAVQAKLGDRNPDRWLWGDPQRIGSILEEYRHRGAEHAIVTFPDAADPESYELLARVRRMFD